MDFIRFAGIDFSYTTMPTSNSMSQKGYPGRSFNELRRLRSDFKSNIWKQKISSFVIKKP